MFGGNTSNLVWHQLGQWAEESSQCHRETADLILGQHPSQINQQHILQLEMALNEAREAALHNYKRGTEEQNNAEHFRLLLIDREKVIAGLDRSVEHWQACLQRERDLCTKKQHTIDKIRQLSKALAKVKKAGKGDWPEYAELLAMRENMLETVTEHGDFDQFSPEQHARWFSLMKTLDAF